MAKWLIPLSSPVLLLTNHEQWLLYCKLCKSSMWPSLLDFGRNREEIKETEERRGKFQKEKKREMKKKVRNWERKEENRIRRQRGIVRQKLKDNRNLASNRKGWLLRNSGPSFFSQLIINQCYEARANIVKLKESNSKPLCTSVVVFLQLVFLWNFS